MADINVTVRAIPLNTTCTEFSVECTLCGVLGLTTLDTNDVFCIDHLEHEHGVDVTPYR